MTEFNIQTRASIPAHVATLLDIGLETERESDRLLALQAANHFDRRNGSSAGAVVVAACARQMDLEFANSTSMLDTSAPWHIRSATHSEGALIREVAEAVGTALGVATVMFELVDTESETGVLSSPGGNGPVDVIDLETVIGRLVYADSSTFADLGEERPYGIMQRFWQGQGMENFETALAAIYGSHGV